MADKKELPRLIGRVAVFIDAANLEKSVADLGTKPPNFKKLKKGFMWKALPKGYYKVDYKKLYKYFKAETTLAGISLYSARFNTKPHDNFLAFLKINGYRLVTKLVKEIVVAGEDNKRKANFDVEISVDAVAWLNNYDTFVLFSGDSDFAYLAQFLKRKGKKVVVISERGHVSNELVKVADKYQDLHTFKSEFITLRSQKSRP
ncbi:MAG: NYN domain-containing protein [Candidatus Curtissbacteria bacterium]